MSKSKDTVEIPKSVVRTWILRLQSIEKRLRTGLEKGEV